MRTQPLRGGSAAPEDIAALEEVKKAFSERAKMARTRAEKWIPGLTALVGLLETVLIVKGTEAAKDLESWAQVVVGILLVIALVTLGLGVYRAYEAAFGDPMNPSTLRVDTLKDLHVRLRAAKVEAETESTNRLRDALFWTASGIVAIAVSIALTWIGAADAEDSNKVCVYDSAGTRIAQIEGSLESVQLDEAGGSIKSC
jgi:hypothetical protein